MMKPSSAGGISVQSVHVVTDKPLGNAQARALGTAIVGDINAALKTSMSAARTSSPRVRIGELRLNVPSAALNDRDALARCARSAAQSILDRSTD